MTLVKRAALSAIALAAVAGSALVLSAALPASPRSTTYWATVVSRQAVSDASLELTFRVTNTGKAAGTPDCLILAANSSGAYHGVDAVMFRVRLAPGASITQHDGFPGVSPAAPLRVRCT
jgi:hypothetical protein